MSAVELVHEEPGEADPGDTELSQTRERGSARSHDVDRALDTPEELTRHRQRGANRPAPPREGSRQSYPLPLVYASDGDSNPRHPA
jgi:hypothetical protein